MWCGYWYGKFSLVLIVEDDGLGIFEENFEIIFECFYMECFKGVVFGLYFGLGLVIFW